MNEKKLNTLGWAIKLIIAVPALIFSIVTMTSGVDGDSDITEINALMESFSFSSAINISIWAVIIAATLVLVFFGVLLVMQPKSAVKSILGIIVATILFFILYAIGTGDTLESLQVVGMEDLGHSAVNFTHAGIWTSIIGIVICTLLAVFMSPIMKLLKK